MQEYSDLKERARIAYSDWIYAEQKHQNEICEESRENFKSIFKEYPERIEFGNIFLGGCKFGVTSSTYPVGMDSIHTDYSFYLVVKCKKCCEDFKLGNTNSLEELGYLLNKGYSDICSFCRFKSESVI